MTPGSPWYGIPASSHSDTSRRTSRRRDRRRRGAASRGGSSSRAAPAHRRARSAGSRRPSSPARRACAATRKWSRASTSSSLRSRDRAPAAHRRPIGISPSRTHWRPGRGAARLRLPVNSLNMSVPNATPLGRTMRSSSSIQMTVGTLLIAYSSVSRCSRVDEHREGDVLGPRPHVVGRLVERDRDDGEAERRRARRAVPATRAGRSGSLTSWRTRPAASSCRATPRGRVRRRSRSGNVKAGAC